MKLHRYSNCFSNKAMHLLIIWTGKNEDLESWILSFNQVTHKFHLRCPLFHRKQWTDCSHHSPNNRPVVGNVWFHGLITLQKRHKSCNMQNYIHPTRKRTYPTNGQVSTWILPTVGWDMFRFWEGHQNYTTWKGSMAIAMDPFTTPQVLLVLPVDWRSHLPSAFRTLDSTVGSH